jgi:hypothetical protein
MKTANNNGEARPMTAREGSVMAIYSITFKNAAGSWEHSRYTETLRAARNWAKWLASKSYVCDVAIHRGGHGGERVAA